MQTTTKTETLEPNSTGKGVAPKEKSGSIGRLLVGFCFLSVGATAIGLGGLSLWAHLNQFTIDNAIVNARIVRVRAPIAGQFNAVYANPGTPVKAGQVLARIKPSMPQEQALLAQQGERQTHLAQLLAAQQSLVQSQQQLAQIGQSGTAVVAVDAALAQSGVEAKRSDVEQARSKVAEARTIYRRYAALAKEGAVTQLLADEKRMGVETAEAALRGTEAGLAQSQTSLNATQSGVQTSPSSLNLSDQRARLMQVIQTQTSLVSTLKADLARIDQQIRQAQSQFSEQKDLVITAPTSGVVYSVASEQSEQVNVLEPVLTVLDCQDLWVEGIVSAQQAGQLNPHQPVQVSLAGESTPIQGEVEMLQAVGNTPVSTAPNMTQLQALTPPIKPDLAGQALMRVIVRVQPTAKTTQAQTFCGVGQVAQMTFAKKPLAF